VRTVAALLFRIATEEIHTLVVVPTNTIKWLPYLIRDSIRVSLEPNQM